MAETALNVILAALATRLPAENIHDRADLIEAALVQHGHLPDPSVPQSHTAEAVEEMAQWLARESRHARYTQRGETGWKCLMESEADLDVAIANAQRYAGTDEGVQRLRLARSILLDWIERKA